MNKPKKVSTTACSTGARKTSFIIFESFASIWVFEHTRLSIAISTTVAQFLSQHLFDANQLVASWMAVLATITSPAVTHHVHEAPLVSVRVGTTIATLSAPAEGAPTTTAP